MDTAKHTFRAALKFTNAVLDLHDLRIWPPSGANDEQPEPDVLLSRIRRAARSLLYQPADVRAVAETVVQAATEYAALVYDIRATTKPSNAAEANRDRYHDAIDVRRVDQHAATRNALYDAHDQFVRLIRAGMDRT